MQPGLRKFLSGFVAVLFVLVTAVPFHAKEASASSKAVEVLKDSDFSLNDEKELKVKKEDNEKEDEDENDDDDAKMEKNDEISTAILDQ